LVVSDGRDMILRERRVGAGWQRRPGIATGASRDGDEVASSRADRAREIITLRTSRIARLPGISDGLVNDVVVDSRRRSISRLFGEPSDPLCLPPVGDPRVVGSAEPSPTEGSDPPSPPALPPASSESESSEGSGVAPRNDFASAANP